MSNASTATERINWIDCIKGIGIYFVILGHIYKCNNIGMWIYSFHMPLFFILSGYLIADKLTVPCYSEYFKKKFKSLIRPFILFRIALILYWWVVESGFRKLDLGPIWFLPILFSIEITIVPILLRHRSLLMTSVYLLINATLFLALKSYPYSSFLYWILLYLNGSVWLLWGGVIRNIKILDVTALRGGHCNTIFSQYFRI